MTHIRGLLLPALLMQSLTLLPSLSAVVDPDLFDGRISSTQKNAQASGSGAGSGSEGSVASGAASEESVGEAGSTSQEGSAASGAASGGTSSNRDFGEIGQFGGGQAVSSPAESVQGSGSASSTNNSTGGNGAGSASGSGQSPAVGSPSGEASEKGAPRDFSEIGGISGVGDAAVEVKTSKTTPAGQATGTSQEAVSSSSGASNNQSNPDQGSTGGSGSQPSRGTGSGDYGKTLPSGI